MLRPALYQALSGSEKNTSIGWWEIFEPFCKWLFTFALWLKVKTTVKPVLNKVQAVNVIVKPFFKSTSIRLHSWIRKGSLLHNNRRRRHHISKKRIVIWSNLIIVRADHSTLVIIRSDQIMSPGSGSQGPFGKFPNIRPILWTPSSFRHVLVFWKCIHVHNYFVTIRMLQMSFWPNKGGSFLP